MSNQSNQEPQTERSTERSIAGGGEVSYTVWHRQADHARAVASKIETAIEMMNARYFQSEPRQRLGTRRTTTEYPLRGISAAVDAANETPSFAKNVDGELEYVVTEGYYPDEYSHHIDVTDIPPGDRSRAFLHAQSKLCQRGYAINSIRTDEDGLLTTFHVVSLRWIYEARSYGRQNEEMETYE